MKTARDVREQASRGARAFELRTRTGSSSSRRRQAEMRSFAPSPDDDVRPRAAFSASGDAQPADPAGQASWYLLTSRSVCVRRRREPDITTEKPPRRSSPDINRSSRRPPSFAGRARTYRALPKPCDNWSVPSSRRAYAPRCREPILRRQRRQHPARSRHGSRRSSSGAARLPFCHLSRPPACFRLTRRPRVSPPLMVRHRRPAEEPTGPRASLPSSGVNRCAVRLLAGPSLGRQVDRSCRRARARCPRGYTRASGPCLAEDQLRPRP
jgi:hypothetical protein